MSKQWVIILITMFISGLAQAHAGKICGDASGTISVTEYDVKIKKGDFLTVGKDTKFDIYINTDPDDTTVPKESRAQIDQQFIACIPGEKVKKTENAADWYWSVTAERVTIKPFDGSIPFEISVICREQSHLPCEQQKGHHQNTR